MSARALRRLAGLALALGALRAAPVQAAEAKEGKAERLERAASSLAEIRRLTGQLVAQCAEARAERDAAKLDCCGEKLDHASKLLGAAERAERALKSALEGEEGGAETESLAIDVARRRVAGVRGEAERCIGQLAWRTDERTAVEVTKPRPLAPGELEKAAARPVPKPEPREAAPQEP
ncbi:MAG TPA: hypothetical protein VFE30_12800 [Anaeromyxobacteraceae bacterium]|jgi:hypothetical protein|nr:hypothetical protein [Anaeromyxobacteraceae bacterium]